MPGEINAYNVVQFLHVVLAIAWVGGGIFLQLMGRYALASRLPGRAAEFSAELADIGKKVFTPLSVLVLLLGLYLVQEGDWGFGSFWVSFSILGIVVSIAIGAGLLGPRSGQVAGLAQSEGADSPAVRERLGGILRLALMDLGLLVFIVFLMVTKLGE